MPTIGGVYVPDNLMPRIAAPERARPGLTEVLSSSAANAAGQLRYGLPYQYRKLSGSLTPEDEAFYQQGLADTAASTARAAPANVQDLTSGRVGIGRFIGENIAASLPYMVGGLAGGIAGAAAGGPGGAIAGAIAGGVPQFSASNVARAVEEQGGLATGSAARSLATAPFQSAADAAIGRFLPGAGHVLGEAAAVQSGGFLRRTATSIAKAGATEAVTEAAQQLGERYAAGVPISNADAAAEYVNAAVTAFAVGGALGAGGGFRRTNAVARPAADVTNEDMVEHVNQILALPAPADITTNSAGTSYVNPNGRIQLALPSPDAFRGPDFVADAEGRVTTPGFEGEQAIAIDRNRPRPAAPPPPTIDEIMARFDAQQPDYGALAAPAPAAPAFDPNTFAPSTDTSATALNARLPQPVVPNTVDAPAPARLFADQTFDDLRAALRAKNASPELRAEAEREVEARRLEAIGDAPLTTNNFQERVDELKDGLRGGFVQSLEATDPVDLRNKVYTEIFENQNTARNVQRLAQRIGLLDEDLNPTERADAIEAERTAANRAEIAPEAPVTAPTVVEAAPVEAPVARTELAATPSIPAPPSPAATLAPPAPVAPAAPAPRAAAPAAPAAPATSTFAQQWEQLKREAGITRSRGLPADLGEPTSLDDARARVFRALATDSSNAEVSQVEKLARKMGLVTDDDAMDVTPLGRQAFLSTAEGQEETISAAQQQGFTGREASIFERGVRSFLAGQPSEGLTSFEDMAAYQAGQVWARQFVQTPLTRTLAQTEAIQARQGRRATVNPDPAAARRELTPAQVQQASLNRLLDAADLRRVSDSDIAALRRMVRNGASATEVGQALQRVQGGQTLFLQPPSRPAALSPLPTRGQPIFREINTPDAGPSRAENRVQSEEAVRAFDLRNLIELARAEGAMTDARAQKLHDLLDAGKIDQVARLTRDFDPDAPAPRRRMPTPPEQIPARGERGELTGPADLAFEQAITGKSFMEALDYLVEQAPSRYYREVMKRVRSLARNIAKTGYSLELQVVRPGDMVPVRLNDAYTRALTVVRRVPKSATVYLKSAEMGPTSGMNSQLAAHEMIHAVTMTLLERGNTPGVYGNTKLGKAVEDLYQLQHAIADHFNARANAGQLNEFEQAFFNRTNNSMLNVDEILAWGLTNPDMQRYLQSIEYKPKQSVFGRLVELLRNLLGLDGKYDTALTELLRISEQVMGPSASDLHATFARNDPDADERAPLTASAREGGVSASNRTVTAANEATQRVAGMAAQVADRINIADIGAKARRAVLGWLSHNQIDRQYGAIMPGLLLHSEAHRQRGAVRGRFENMGQEAYQQYEQLARDKPKMADAVSRLMARSTEFQLDPDKAFDDHTHLANDPNAARLRVLHRELVKLRNDLSRGDGAGIKVYNTFRQLNEAQNYARMATSLHSLVAMDPELSLGVRNATNNPVDEFMVAPGLTAPADVRAWWQQALQRQVGAALSFVNQKRGETVGGTDSERRAMQQHLSPIEMQIQAIQEAVAGMARAPYFHLGRYGDNYGSAVIRTNADGTVDTAAQRHVAEELEKAGFMDAQISPDNTRPRVSMRFDTVDQTNRFRALMLRLQKEGWLSSEEIKAGPRVRENNYGASEGLPAFVQRYIQSLEASPVFVPDEGMSTQERAALAERKEDAIRLAVDTWLEQQPDTSISKVLTKRYTVAGYNPDMARNFAHRWHVGSISIANVATSPKFNQAYVEMRAHVNEAASANNDLDPNLATDIMAEMRTRDASAPINPIADGFDKLRAFSHAYFLGFSPAYGAINMTQLGVTALPELAKVHGYAKSFHAMRRATTKAFAIIRAASAEARALGPRNAADLVLMESALKKAGLDARTADFTRQMLAAGSLDIGTSARALGRVSEGVADSKFDTAMKYAGAMGLYTETFSRLVTSLAAFDLHGGSPADGARYATSVVSNSMFDYQNWNTARQLGKQGFAGPVTPLLTQFMSYSVQVTEKLYSEAMDAFTKARPGESAQAAKERRAGARRFLLGHITAVTALAGTLGMPFASAFASVIERLVDAFDDDDDPFDATAAWRGFLADVLGQDVAEVVARGLPRAVGFDISKRAGEADLFPFTQLLTDRRSWKESIQSMAGQSIGAGPSMLLSLAEGGEKFGQGDILGGLKAFVPVAFKGPVEVYRMTTDGYVDTRGTKLPMTSKASAYLWQLLGFSPSERAEYSEARADQQARRGEISRRAGILRQGIVRAMVDGDTDRARELISNAVKFDQDNPAFAVVPSLTGSLQRQLQARTRAQITRSPLGVGMDDVAGQRLTSYANVDY